MAWFELRVVDLLGFMPVIANINNATVVIDTNTTGHASSGGDVQETGSVPL